MAGGFGVLPHLKNPKLGNNLSSEALQDSPEVSSDKKQTKISLKGILGLGQSVDINKNTSNSEKQSKELFYGLNHLAQEQNVLFDQHQKELEKELISLRDEIGKLAQATDNLEKDVANVALSNISEVSEYQLNFLSRIRIFIENFRKNISDAGLWIEAFAAKKKKKNAFWNNVKDKKKGGDQYLFSNEHSAARSVS
jgi:hypothetical protein